MTNAKGTLQLRLPEDVYADVKRVSEVEGVSMNWVLVEAARAHVKDFERNRIDQEFEDMETDVEYQRMTLEICEDFAYSDAGSRF